MTNAKLQQFLADHQACVDARVWLGDLDLAPAQAWRECPRGDWLLWAAVTVGVDRTLVVRAACACARLALQYLPAGELRPLRCLEVTERWCDGRATIDEMRTALADADSYAALATACAANAALATGYAALATAYAANAALATAYAAARMTMQNDTARAVRKAIPLEIVMAAVAQLESERVPS